jgi:hypothetical protein
MLVSLIYLINSVFALVSSFRIKAFAFTFCSLIFYFVKVWCLPNSSSIELFSLIRGLKIFNLELDAMQGCICVGIGVWLERTQTWFFGYSSFHFFLRFTQASSTQKDVNLVMNLVQRWYPLYWKFVGFYLLKFLLGKNVLIASKTRE